MRLEDNEAPTYMYTYIAYRSGVGLSACKVDKVIILTHHMTGF